MLARLGTQGHVSLGRVPFATMGGMAGCLWSHRGHRRYAGGVSAAWYGCSLGYSLPGGVIGFRLPTPPGPVGAGGRGGLSSA